MKKISFLLLIPFVLFGCSSSATLEEQREYCKSIGMILADEYFEINDIRNTRCIRIRDYCSVQCNDLYGYSADEYFLSECFDECNLDIENK